MAPETLPSAFYLALDPSKPSPSSWSSLLAEPFSRTCKVEGVGGGSSVPESIPVCAVALPIPEHFLILGGGQPLMVLFCYLLQADTDLGVRDHLARLPAHKGTSTPRTSTKGCLSFPCTHPSLPELFLQAHLLTTQNKFCHLSYPYLCLPLKY